ncbi:MAG TPA: hypothetical protein VFT64_05440 [Rickettsiales bacterium]|nr:hypothetical protein [Rickettsiales bacterium]
MSILKFISDFIDGWKGGSVKPIQEDKQLRHKMSERKIDKMVSDSFPASDPPSTY